MESGIREVEVERDDAGDLVRVHLVLGPHYFVELNRGSGSQVTFVLGATHHGFKADASHVAGELEGLINEIREAHPETLVD